MSNLPKTEILDTLSVVSELSENLPNGEVKDLSNNYISNVIKILHDSNQPEKKTQPKKAPAKKSKAEPKKAEIENTPVENKLATADTAQNVETSVVKSLKETINDLPNGDIILAKAPYDRLFNLDKDRVLDYLAGVKVSAIVTTELIEKATQQGANKDWINTIMVASTMQQTKVEGAIDLNSEELKPVREKLMQSANSSPENKMIYDLLSRNGVNKQVIADYNTLIAG